MRFNLQIENVLHRLDGFFKEKSQKDMYMIYIMIVAVFFSFAYPFYDIAHNNFENLKKEVTDISTKLNEHRAYLQVNTQEKVSKLDSEIKYLESELITQKNSNIYIKNKIETISALIYDEKAWGAYLNSISINAQKHSVELLKLSNQYTFNNDFSFGHVLDISLKVQGSYENIVKFINSLEQSELVVDVHDFSIRAQDKLNSDINISVWGITYR